ncbi:MAG: hypothetical protein C4310_09150 [Chloroflexota bacterium]
MAIVSLVTGILGLTLCVGLGGVIALITGYMARNEIRQKPGMYTGEGLATAGLVLGGVGIAYFVLSLVLGVLGFMFAMAFSLCATLGLSPWLGQRSALLLAGLGLF